MRAGLRQGEAAGPSVVQAESPAVFMAENLRFARDTSYWRVYLHHELTPGHYGIRDFLATLDRASHSFRSPVL